MGPARHHGECGECLPRELNSRFNVHPFQDIELIARVRACLRIQTRSVMDAIVNIVGTFVAGLCAVLLLRAYAAVRKRLLLWSGLCFAGLTAANALLIVDLQVLAEEVDLYSWRLGVAAIAMLLLVYGLIFESE